jgi:hypothetical protein
MDTEITSLRLASPPSADGLVTIAVGEVRVAPSYRDREHSSTVANIIELVPRDDHVGAGRPAGSELLPGEALDHGVVNQAEAQNPIV